MDASEVARKWIWYGIEDLYFAFCIEFNPHKSYALFAEIMGLEKILKAYLLFKNGNTYSILNSKESQTVIECLVKKWGHSIKTMLKEVANLQSNEELKRIKERSYDGFVGTDLVKVIEAGYMESRYPVSRPIYEQFKIKGVDIYQNPLESSGVTKFIYEICGFILIELKKEMDLEAIKKDFIHVYGSREQTKRFIKIMFNGNINNYL